jgi:hypothetical protein
MMHLPLLESLVEAIGLLGGTFETLVRNRPIRSESIM